ncbi:Transthyretin-like family protein [Teladorsagia circumcincta]|uniref:Transthyretin-like family protein n=1 Tax=Teladorsagia circumcincta TaxID=45464 RepID=A0A2G9TXX2_TELCI|nr:Transthyretin-like family protein [Teladorsagia circumcincta]
MAETRTDPHGKFRLSGWKKEFSKIDPKIHIYHKCNHEGGCFRKISLPIPKSYITVGKKPKDVFHMGNIELENKYLKETIKCFK